VSDVPDAVLRPFVPADLEACVAVWVRALEARDGVAAPAGTAERVRGRLARDDHRTVVAEQAGRVAGFATTVPEGPGTLLLQHLAVAPDVAGRGLGRRLLADAVAHAAGRPLALDVRIGNGRAIALYERAGFARAGEPVPHPLGGEPMVRYERAC
jgi:ribosomal protein S18 acetylase RimI-like enzyme